MENLPFYISIVFAFTTIFTVLVFYKATGSSKKVMVILLLWLALQAIISRTGFYTDTHTLPPKFLLTVLPPLICIIILFLTKKGRQLIDSINIETLTLLHITRIPVELVLFWLFIHKAIPQVMTFEGRNFDILSGITTPIIYYLVFAKKLGNKILLIWNLLCLGLLINIVATAILSAPFPFQKFGFEQPNVALFYFPFVWLPCCVVPLVLFAHLVVLRRVWRGESKKPTELHYAE